MILFSNSSEKLVKGLTADKVPALSKQWALERKKWLHSLLVTLPALTQGSEDKVDEISGCVCGVAGSLQHTLKLSCLLSFITLQ